MPEHELAAERQEEKPPRKRRLTLMESYGAFSDDRLREVTAKIRHLTSPKLPEEIPSDVRPDPIGESIGDQIGESIGTPIQTPIERPIDSPDDTPNESPDERSNDSLFGRDEYSPLLSSIESPYDSPNVSPNESSPESRAQAAVLLTENQAILYFCLQKINGAVTSLSRIGRECRISEHTLKSCLKKLRQEGLILYGGRRNCGGRIGFTAKTVERRIILQGDKARLSRRLQQINHQALIFTEALDDVLNTSDQVQSVDHPMTHPIDYRMNVDFNHQMDHLMTHLMDHPMDTPLCSSSIKEQLLQGLIFEDAFQDLNPRSLLPFLQQFNSTDELQNFLDMANACIAASKEGHGKPIQNPTGFLISCLRVGYINPPEGYKSRKVRAQEIRNRQLERELATLRQLKEREKQLRFELFQATLSDEDQERLTQEAQRKVNPDLGLSATRQMEVYKEEILKQWFAQRERS